MRLRAEDIYRTHLTDADEGSKYHISRETWRYGYDWNKIEMGRLASLVKALKCTGTSPKVQRCTAMTGCVLDIVIGKF
jgi:hypothetical protein